VPQTPERSLPGSFAALCLPAAPEENAMVVAVVLLWSGMPVLPPRLQQQPDKNAVRQEFVERWLEEWMAKETAERPEQVQRVLDEQRRRGTRSGKNSSGERRKRRPMRNDPRRGPR
jgi:hypothetical protein